MRKKFVYFALVPAVVLIIVVYLFIDGWVTSGLEAAGEAMTGAKVEFHNLSVTLSPLGLRWGRLEVADPHEPMKNLFETGKVQFALNFGQLLRGKYIVETMEVNDLILGTQRTTSGELPKKAEPKKELTKEEPSTPGAFASLADQASSVVGGGKKLTPSFDLATIRKNLNVDSLLNPKNLQSYRLIDSLHQQIQSASAQWQTTLGEIDKSKQKLSTMETSVKAINVNELKTAEQITNALNTVKNAVNTANEVKQTFTQQQTTLTESVNKFTSSAKLIDDAAKQDFDRVVAAARLPDVSMKGLAELVLGKDIMARATGYLYWVDFARKNIPSGTKEQKEPQPARMKGQNIRFPEERSYPKFWVKKILLSGGTDKTQKQDYFYAKGEVLNITDNQKLTGQPLTAAVAFSKGPSLTVALNAMFDRRKDEPLDTYKARATGIQVASMEIGRADFLPSKITHADAQASIDVTVPGNKFDSETKIQFSGLTFAFGAEPRNTVERIVRDVLQSIKGFQVNLRMWSPGNKFDVAFATDLDDQIASRTKKVLGDEIARIQNDLRNKLNQRIADKRKEFETMLNQKKNDAMAKLKGYESLVNDKLAMVQNKKNEIEKKQTDALKKKGQDLLKGLIKK
ncbi:MAG TPA: TIGR03545 family protein [Bacteroidota bacterium]